jgi:hypothetical protein
MDGDTLLDEDAFGNDDLAHGLSLCGYYEFDQDTA